VFDTRRQPHTTEVLGEALGSVRSRDLLGLDDRSLLQEIEELTVAQAQLEAAVALRLARSHARESTVSEFGHGVKTWLVKECRLGRVDAGRRVAVARGLAAHPRTARAWADGDISYEHVRAVFGCFRHLPIGIHDYAETVLVDAARTMSVDDLHVILDRLRDLIGDETAAEREQRRFDSRWCTAVTTFDSMTRLEAMLDPESGQTVTAALNALMGKRTDGDERTEAQRRADALVDLARIAFTSGQLPDHCGDRPHVTVTIGLDQLTAPDDSAASGDRSPRPAWNGGPLTPTSDGMWAQEPASTGCWNTETQTWDGPLPATFRLPDVTDLTRPADPVTRGRLGTGGIDTQPLSASAARRIACDARIIPVVLNGESQILDLGRDSATWTVHQRRAAAVRDRGCVWPDCDASLARCQLHHLHHWAHGGDTNVDNSAHLCHFHHWLVHHRNWTIHRHPTTKQITVRRT
jgi:hypothetical protein